MINEIDDVKKKIIQICVSMKNGSAGTHSF